MPLEVKGHNQLGPSGTGVQVQAQGVLGKSVEVLHLKKGDLTLPAMEPLPSYTLPPSQPQAPFCCVPLTCVTRTFPPCPTKPRVARQGGGLLKNPSDHWTWQCLPATPEAEAGGSESSRPASVNLVRCYLKKQEGLGCGSVVKAPLGSILSTQKKFWCPRHTEPKDIFKISCPPRTSELHQIWKWESLQM